jgi:hypothetical protein
MQANFHETDQVTIMISHVIPESRLNDFRVISTSNSLWQSYLTAELYKRTGGLVTVTDLLNFSDNLNDLYTMLIEDCFTFILKGDDAATISTGESEMSITLEGDDVIDPDDVDDACYRLQQTRGLSDNELKTLTTLYPKLGFNVIARLKHLIINRTAPAAKTQEENTMTTQDTAMITLTRLSQNQITTIGDFGTLITGKMSMTMPADTALAHFTAMLDSEPAEGVTKTQHKRVVKQIIGKVAKATGVDVPKQSRVRMPNNLPATVVKMRTSKTQQAMLDYLDKKFITGFVFGRGATYTAINLVLRDSAIALLTEMHSHRLNTRSCTTLINRLGDYETMQGSLPTTDITELVSPDMFADAPVVDAPKLPTNLNMDDLFDDLEPAIAPKAQEPAIDTSHDVAADILSDLLDEPAPALDVDQDINDILDDLQPSFNVHQDDSWNELLEPSQEELDAIEEEEYRNAPCEDDPEELAAFELLEAKVHNKNKQSPAHKATTIEEYRAMINGYADEDNDVPADENTVSIEEVALEDDGDDDDDAFAAYGEWDEVSLPLTREYWGDAIGRADVILADMGFEVEDDYVTLPRKHVKSMVIRLRQLSIHGYQGADILDEFEDEIDDELDLWSAAQWQG